MLGRQVDLQNKRNNNNFFRKAVPTACSICYICNRVLIRRTMIPLNEAAIVMSHFTTIVSLRTDFLQLPGSIRLEKLKSVCTCFRAPNA